MPVNDVNEIVITLAVFQKKKVSFTVCVSFLSGIFGMYTCLTYGPQLQR